MHWFRKASTDFAMSEHKCTVPFIFLLVILSSGCAATDYYHIPAQDAKGAYNAVIEIPAGTSKKLEYDPIEKEFQIDRINGEDRTIDFLPYPANYGFIPSTLSQSEYGGDGDALDVLVISEAEPTGTIMSVLPVCVLKLIDDGELDYKILAVPAEKSKRIIRATTYAEFKSNYNELLEIVALWFLSYNPEDSSSIQGWGNESEAIEEISRSLKK
ncbi:inorganic diphosphatase [Pareuzebyella sediminis]|nr:inorganic diphosphatase [Pareuzebyella sediminis]